MKSLTEQKEDLKDPLKAESLRQKLIKKYEKDKDAVKKLEELNDPNWAEKRISLIERAPDLSKYPICSIFVG